MRARFRLLIVLAVASFVLVPLAVLADESQKEKPKVEQVPITILDAKIGTYDQHRPMFPKSNDDKSDDFGKQILALSVRFSGHVTGFGYQFDCFDADGKIGAALIVAALVLAL